MHPFIDFIKKVGNAFNPLSYHQVADEQVKDNVWYAVKVLFLGMFIGALLFLPTVLTLPNALQKEFSAIEVIDGDANVTMSRPIEYPKQNPYFVFDTTGTITTVKDEKILITGEAIYFKFLGSQKRIQLKRLTDPDAVQQGIGYWLIAAILFLLPSILLWTVILLGAKFTILTFLTALILFFILRVMLLFHISFARTMNAALYASTALMLLEFVFAPIEPSLLIPLIGVFGLNFYLIPYIVFVFLLVFGLTVVERNLFGKKGGEFHG